MPQNASEAELLSLYLDSIAQDMSRFTQVGFATFTTWFRSHQNPSPVVGQPVAPIPAGLVASMPAGALPPPSAGLYPFSNANAAGSGGSVWPGIAPTPGAASGSRGRIQSRNTHAQQFNRNSASASSSSNTPTAFPLWFVVNGCSVPRGSWLAYAGLPRKARPNEENSIAVGPNGLTASRTSFDHFLFSGPGSSPGRDMTIATANAAMYPLGLQVKTYDEASGQLTIQVNSQRGGGGGAYFCGCLGPLC